MQLYYTDDDFEAALITAELEREAEAMSYEDGRDAYLAGVRMLEERRALADALRNA